MLRTRSVRSPGSRSDGLRILATRYRGHGVPKEACDVWMPNLAASEALLKGYLAGTVSWPEYRRRYREEMLPSKGAEPGNPRQRNRGQKYTLRLLKELSQRQNVTLMCHCADDEPQCHLRVLVPLIESV